MTRPSENQFLIERPSSWDEAHELMNEFGFISPSPWWYKYVVVIESVYDALYLYELPDCSDHGAALQLAYQVHEQKNRPRMDIIKVEVWGICNDEGCGCGQLRVLTAAYMEMEITTEDSDA